MSKASPKKSTKTSSDKASVTGGLSEDALPGVEEVASLLAPVKAFALGSQFSRIRKFLKRLLDAPPQVILIEGGTADERAAAAHYWAALLNCDGGSFSPVAPHADSSLSLLPGLPHPEQPHSGPDNHASDISAPCLECTSCIRFITHMHRDCFFLDGLAGSIKIDDIRALRAVLGEPPREAQRRVVIFREAQALGEAAANSLLKSFEEPRPGTSFIMLVPQRERLLPTLVSRSFALTLPWPTKEDAVVRESLTAWEAALCNFLRSGRDLFERTGTKGAVDAALVHAISNICRRALVQCIIRKNDATGSAALMHEGLESLLIRLPEARMRMLDEALAECQDSLIYGVNPTLVLEWLATRMYLLYPRGSKVA